MQSLKMIIPGSYYDTQIYSGRLYLWCADSSIRVINWDKLIESIRVEENLWLALECGFRKSDYLYGSRWNLIFRDVEIRSAITNKFLTLAQRPIEISEQQLAKAEVKHQNNPITFPHSDSVIYNGKIYIGGQKGVFATSCNKRNVNPVSLRSTKKWDGPVLTISASYSALSLSSGNEGLFELYLGNKEPWWFQNDNLNRNEVHQLSQLHSSSSRWAFYSIFSSSHQHSGYLVDFDKGNIDGADRTTFRRRIFCRVIPSEEIFHSKSYSWGIQDKICQVIDRTIKVVQYIPWNKESKFKSLGEIRLRDFKGEVVFGDSAIFGFVIECDNGLVVIDSNLNNIWIDGEPINWRVFPRSKHYENHLHIVYENRLEIYSFNDDYFVDQERKKVGLKYTDWKR